MRVRDYFAELYVAGTFADAGWNVYFPHRDKGFDFIVSRSDSRTGHVIRPVRISAAQIPLVERPPGRERRLTAYTALS